MVCEAGIVCPRREGYVEDLPRTSCRPVGKLEKLSSIFLVQ